MSTYQAININRLTASQTNPRKDFNLDKLRDLAASLKEKGMLQPILVRPSRGCAGQDPGDPDFEIICGERRFRAALLADLEEVPVIISDMDDQAVLEVQVIENLQREDVHPLEEAEGFEQLIKHYGQDGAEQIAAKIGKSRTYVYSTMKLCALTPPLRKAFYEGSMDRSVALLLARMPEALQTKAADKIGIHDSYLRMPYRRAKEYIKENFTLNLKKAPFNTKQGDLVLSAGNCVECPKRTGNQAELFADIGSADVCTDPVCFKKKKEAHVKQTQEEVALAGHTVLPKAVAKEIIYDGERRNWGSGIHYVELTERCHKDPQDRTYKKLLKDIPEADIVVAFDDDGREHRMILISKAVDHMIAAGFEFAKEIHIPVGSPVKEKDPADVKKAKEKEQREAEAKELLDTKIMNQFVAKVQRESTNPRDVLNVVLFQMLNEAEPWLIEKVTQRRGMNLSEAEFFTYAKDSCFMDRLGLLAEMIYLLADEFSYGDSIAHLACQAYEIDHKALLKEARAEVRKNHADAAKAAKQAAKAEKKAAKKKAPARKKGKAVEPAAEGAFAS